MRCGCKLCASTRNRGGFAPGGISRYSGLFVDGHKKKKPYLVHCGCKLCASTRNMGGLAPVAELGFSLILGIVRSVLAHPALRQESLPPQGPKSAGVPTVTYF